MMTPDPTITETTIPAVSNPGLVAVAQEIESKQQMQQREEGDDIEAPIPGPPPSAPISTTDNNNKSLDSSTHSVGSFGHSIKKRFSRKDESSAGGGGSKAAPVVIPPATKAPKETLKAVYAAGKYKAGLTWNVLAVQSFMAGVYISFAGQLYLSVGGGVLGAALFPGGLIAVILTSAELFTGDALIFVASVLGGQVKIYSLLRNWTEAWIMNFVGCICWAYMMGYLSDAIEDSGAKELAIKVAEKKALNEMSSIFIKAIGANFMVCVAVWQGTCAEEVAGKVLALWFPTAAFVMMGFDHVVANMFLIPVGMMLGADVSVGRMFAALFMATLGNVIGGGVFVGAVYWYVFDSMASFGGLTSRIRQTMQNVNIGRALHHAGTSSFRSNHSHAAGGPAGGVWGINSHNHQRLTPPRDQQQPQETTTTTHQDAKYEGPEVIA